MLIGYARVSTEAQDTRLQLDALKRDGCKRILEEKASGSKADRPELQRLLDTARKGDVVIVCGRTVDDLVPYVIERGQSSVEGTGQAKELTHLR